MDAAPGPVPEQLPDELRSQSAPPVCDAPLVSEIGAPALPEPPSPIACFARNDWFSFWLTTAIALAAYLLTLAPEVTLEWSGTLATGAAYGSGGAPSGYPLWTIYAWLFTRLLPISNIAWRIAVSSALAGSLCCGMLALIVCRGSTILLESIGGFRRLANNEELILRIASGTVAGLGFAFHNVFWGQSVIVESTALGMLLFCSALAMLLRWFIAPTRPRFLFAAFLFYGLSLSVSYTFIAAAAAFPILLALGRPALGRDFSFLMAATTLTAVFAFQSQFGGLWVTWLIAAIFLGFFSLILILITRRLLTEWRVVLGCFAAICSGLSFYLYLPIAAMSTPPMNWGYPRTVEGFIHLVTRGQFERFNPISLPDEGSRFGFELYGYVRETFHAVGWPYIILVPLPFVFIRKMQRRTRHGLLAIVALFLALSFLVLAVMNPPPDRSAWSLMMLYFPASHLVLLILAGLGLSMLGTIIARCFTATHASDTCVEAPALPSDIDPAKTLSNPE